MIVTTSICANYIPKARALAESVKKHHPDAHFVPCIVERERLELFQSPGLFDDILMPSDLNIPALESFLFRYSIVEASTAIKGHLMLKLFDLFPEEQVVIYLDPDTWVRSPLVELLDVLKSKEIVLTPHLTEPETHLEAVLDNEVCALRHGAFNLGFLGVSRGQESARFLNWWADRLYFLCFADYARGLFTDQKWIDLAPGMFDCHIFKHPGYNVAPWNLSRRVLTDDVQGQTLVNGLPLRFFHFSGLDSGANIQMIRKYSSDPNSPIYRLRDSYLETCKKFGQEELGSLPWTLGRYHDGETIQPEHRRTYRDAYPQAGHNPYVEAPAAAPAAVPSVRRPLWKRAIRKVLRLVALEGR